MSRSDFEAYKQAKDQIAHLEAEMAEFQASSRELERELEMELEESEERHKSLQNTINVLNHELDEYKTKHRLLQKEFAALQASLQREIVTLQTAHKEAYGRLREIEMANDDMERMERYVESQICYVTLITF
ncbi:hypothetical protein DV113_000302 [Geotrichum candidum]|nr:hypothetical protein DV452_003233 [Geotrichum candidum]KAF7501767.1 hypothetical protein DV113_000302 [Geotrichum candidum]KAI8134081.1 hypothetical protein DUD61_002296 [Geotrichum candidum]